MKDIKTYIIGFLSCACLFLFMGQTSNNSNLEKILNDINLTLIENNKIGRYQASTGPFGMTIMFDTETGETYQYRLSMIKGEKDVSHSWWEKMIDIDSVFENTEEAENKWNFDIITGTNKATRRK